MTRQMVAHYRLISALGKGGMGEVYLAEDTRLRRRVALKLLPDRVASDDTARARLLREAQASATLDHENICTIFEVGHADDVSFIAMQLIEGESLAQRLDRECLGIEQAASLGAQIADALAAAHEIGVVHRDIKPQNIMVTPRGQAKVLDFGIAKLLQPPDAAEQAHTRQSLTAAGTIVGTTAYMSPEQLHGQSVDARSDVFSLGVVLHEMVHGRHPFAAQSVAGTVAAILTQQPPPLAAEGPHAAEYGRIALKCLEKDVERRYQFARDVAVDLRTIGHAPATVTDVAAAQTRRRRTPWQWWAGAAALVAATVSAFLLLSPREQVPSAAGSIAILPFVSSDAAADYLAEGVSDSLINGLSQLPQLKVIARATTFRYRGSAVDVSRIRRDLGVDHIVSGRVTQQGDMLVVQADLTDAIDGSQVWGQRYNRRLSDLFTVQEEIAKEIASSLRLRLSGREQAGLAKRYTANIDAYRKYLLGRAHAQQRTIAGLEKAAEYYTEAIALDPRYALAYAGLTDVYTNLTPRGRIEASDGRARARQAAERALGIDPDLAEAHAAIGQTHVYSAPYDFANGDRALRRAIELSPSWAIAHQYLGVSLLEQGRVDAALAEWETARELDPLSPFMTRLLAHVHLVRRDYPRSLTLLREANQLGPPFALHSEIEIYVQNGAFAEALVELERLSARRDTDPYLLFASAMVAAGQGRRTEALAIGSQLETVGAAPLKYAFLLAKLHLTLGNIETALQLLERAFDARTIPIIYPGAPVWDPVRSDGRFNALLARMGIPST